MLDGVVVLGLLNVWLTVLPKLALAPFTVPTMLVTVQLYVLGKDTVGIRVKAPQVLTETVGVITGVGNTVTTTEATLPTQPGSEVGVTEYIIVPVAELDELLRLSLIKDEGEAFELEPVIVPASAAFHVNVLNGVALRVRLVFSPSHILVPVVEVTGVALTVNAGDNVGMLVQPRPGNVTVTE